MLYKDVFLGKKVRKILFIVCFFISKSALSMEVLSSETRYYSVSSISDEPKYPFVCQVVHDPDKVGSYKENPLLSRAVSFVASQKSIPMEGSSVMMGEMRFLDCAAQGNSLYTAGLRDCIALAIFDPESQKACLYHASKMEINPNDFGEILFTSYHLPSIKFFFKEHLSRACVTLVASCYTQDLKNLLEMLDSNGIQVTHFCIPDIALEKETQENKQKETLKASYTISVNKDTLEQPLLEMVVGRKSVPSTAVKFNREDGSVEIFRD